MSITSLPTPPSRNDDPDTFVTRSDAFIGALPVFVTETNELASNIETDAETINTAIETAEGHATSAGESAAAASDSADAAALSEDNAEIFAAAAQAAIGIPALEGNAGNSLLVNAEEDGVQWASPLPDLEGNSGKVLAVNSLQTGTDWVDPFPSSPNAVGSLVTAGSLDFSEETEYNIGHTVPGSSLIVNTQTSSSNIVYSLSANSNNAVAAGDSVALGYTGTWRLHSRVARGTGPYPVGLFQRIA